MLDLTATRAHALARLQVLPPAMGRRYTNRRNDDRVPGRRTAVATQSPWVHRQRVTAADVAAAAVTAHGPDAGSRVAATWTSGTAIADDLLEHSS